MRLVPQRVEQKLVIPAFTASGLPRPTRSAPACCQAGSPSQQRCNSSAASSMEDSGIAASRGNGDDVQAALAPFVMLGSRRKHAHLVQFGTWQPNLV